MEGASYLTYRNIDLDNTAVTIKPADGYVHGWYLSNSTSSKIYVKLYEGATAPTVGTTTPLVTIQVPANGSANVEYLRGISFSRGIHAACTADVADAATTDPGANACIANFFYQ